MDPRTEELIEFLVDDRYPYESRLHYCPVGGYATGGYDDRVLEEIEDYRLLLRSKSAADLERLVAEEQHKQQIALEAAERKRFFNDPAAAADFSYWSKAACWTLEEATALALGRNPKIVNWESVNEHVDHSPFARRYQDLRFLIERANLAGQLSDPVVPALFIAWTKQIEFEFPYALEAEDAAREKRMANRGGKEFHPKERESVLTLIIAMATKNYNYNPNNLRNEAIKRITSHVNDVGLSIDEDTVRKWLKEAAELQPRIDTK
jgi:hypothetical protein